MLCLVLFGWLKRHQFSVAVHPDQTQTPEDAQAHQRPVDRAKRDGRCHWRWRSSVGWGAVMTPVASASTSGFALAVVGGILVMVLAELRRFRQEVV